MIHEMNRAIHIDFHTPPDIYDFESGWDAAAFAGTLADSHVQYVNVTAKCNMGFCYFDTDGGCRYPYLKSDMYGDALRECHKRGIGVSAYFNLGLDHEMCRRHREWSVVSADGEVISGDRTENWFRCACIHSGYGDYLFGLISEVIEKYPETDGIFLDCVHMRACYGNECLEAIRDAGGDPLDDAQVKQFAVDQTVAFLRRVKKLIGNRHMFCNGVPYAMGKQNDIPDHIEVECLPTGSFWGYDYFPAHMAYARTNADKLLYMSGRFQHDWGDFGGLKPRASFEYDIWDAVMNGAVCSVGDHMHPARGLDDAVYAIIADIYGTLKASEPYIKNAKYCCETAILIPTDNVTDGTEGGARMLGELHIPFDVINTDADFSKYRLIFIAEEKRLDEAEAKKLSDYIHNGGAVLGIGTGGLKPGCDTFALSGLPFVCDGLDDADQVFYRCQGDAKTILGARDEAAYEAGILLKAAPDADAEIPALAVKAYHNRIWDGFHGYFYMPPEKETGYAAAVLGKRVGQIAPNLFRSYRDHAYAPNRELLAYCIRQLLPEPMLTTKGIPTAARVSVTENDAYTLLHVKVSHPEPRGRMNVVAEHAYLPAGAEITLRGIWQSAVTVPDGTPVLVSHADGKTMVTLPQICGYLCIALKR